MIVSFRAAPQNLAPKCLVLEDEEAGGGDQQLGGHLLGRFNSGSSAERDLGIW